jgi:hypothetical protein
MEIYQDTKVTTRFAFQPDGNGRWRYGIGRSNQGVSSRAILTTIGAAKPSRSVRLPAEWDAENGWLVVDFAPLLKEVPDA